MLEPLSRATLADQASRALKRLILERQLLPGYQLPSERGLTELLGVSRTVVREALHMLVAEGLLVKEASRGIFVREFDTSHLWGQLDGEAQPSTHARGLLEVRAALEIGALSLIAQRITPDELTRLDQIVAEMRARLEANLPIGEQDQHFHSLLSEATHNSTFTYFRRLVQDAIQTSTQSGAATYVRPMDRNSVETAERIAGALHQHLVDDAMRAMRAHLLIERPPQHARLVLFLDEEAIAESQGMTARLMTAHKFPHNPILRAEHPWEGESVAPSATVLYDGDQMLYRLWYYGSRLLSPREQLSSLCFATSMDGVHWTKPKLGEAAHEGSGENNLVMPWGDPVQGDVISATILPKAGLSDTQYDMVYLTSGVHPSGVWHAASPDGLRWQSVPEQPVDVGGAFPVGDALYCLAEPEADRFAAYYRLPLRVAAQPTIGRMESHDLCHWGGHRAILSTDDQDPPDAELHGLTPFRYGSLTLAILWIHRRSTNSGELQLAGSRDGITWTRLGERQPLLRSGGAGSFDQHGLTQVTVPIVVGSELWFYYAGASHSLNSGDPRHQIGLATMALDRFVALEAGPEEGWVTTKAFDASTQSRLLLNAVVNPGGYVLVEALTEENQPIPGFTRAEALPVEGNVIYHRVNWRGQEDLSALAGRTIRLRFYSCRAALYAFRLAHPEASLSDLLAGIC